jgi:hypothetical protein
MAMRPRSAVRPDLARNVLLGAALGAGLGGIFLVIGLARFALFLVRGGSAQPITWADVRPMAYYVGGFALAGAFVGLVRPFLRHRAAAYAAMAVGGAIVMNVIAISDKGITGMEGVDWLAMTLIGAVFGLAGARGFLGKT